MMPKGEPLYQTNELASKQYHEIIEIIRNIQKVIRTKFNECAKKYGFTVPQLAVIVHLYKTPGIALHDLTDHMMLTKSTVSGIVDRLAKQGVVVREIPKDNRRIVKLSISKDFTKNNDINNMENIFISHIVANSFKNMDPEEVEKIIYGLRRFSCLLNDNKCE